MLVSIKYSETSELNMALRSKSVKNQGFIF